MNIAICHRCEFGNGAKQCHGACPCKADPQRRDILVMVTLNKSDLPEPCPLRTGDYTPQPSPTRTAFGPGSVIEIVLERMGYQKGWNCGCAEFRDQMNTWGWWACAFKHRAKVVEWFTVKAKEQGVAIDGDGVWSLVRAGFIELLANRVATSSANK